MGPGPVAGRAQPRLGACWAAGAAGAGARRAAAAAGAGACCTGAAGRRCRRRAWHRPGPSRLGSAPGATTPGGGPGGPGLRWCPSGPCAPPAWGSSVTQRPFVMACRSRRRACGHTGRDGRRGAGASSRAGDAAGASAGGWARFNPSRSALRRTRSACASSMLEEWLVTPIPMDRASSRPSLLVRPSSRASSYTRIFLAKLLVSPFLRCCWLALGRAPPCVGPILACSEAIASSSSTSLA